MFSFVAKKHLKETSVADFTGLHRGFFLLL